MNRETLIQNLKYLKLIAHRLGHEMTKYPENSLVGLEAIFENNEMLNACNGFEFDICYTKDHIPIVIHDKYIDDVSDRIGTVNSYTYEELKKINFNFRKSANNKSTQHFKISSLEELLTFFSSHKEKLDNKIIKFETKDAFIFDKKDWEILAEILKKFPDLSNNLVHLSYWPQNLSIFRKIQQQKKYDITKTDLLCDYNIIAILSKYMKFLDFISFRIKSKNSLQPSIQNTNKVNKHIIQDKFFMNFTNALNEKTLQYAINKYGSVGIYVFNNHNDVDELSNKISDEFFEQSYDKIFLTTDNPLYLKKCINKK